MNFSSVSVPGAEWQDINWTHNKAVVSGLCSVLVSNSRKLIKPFSSSQGQSPVSGYYLWRKVKHKHYEVSIDKCGVDEDISLSQHSWSWQLHQPWSTFSKQDENWEHNCIISVAEKLVKTLSSPKQSNQWV